MEMTQSLKFYYETVQKLENLSDTIKISVLKDLFFLGILSSQYDEWGKNHLKERVEETLKQEGV